MAKITLSEKQKELDIDLWIIMIVSLISFVVFMIFQKDIYGFIKNEKVPILSRVLLAATFQYGLAGFGITIVSILRKESFLSYGLKTRGMFSSILLCVLCFVPNIIFSYSLGQSDRYLPFAWGFFEGFNYVVIGEKINRRYPTNSKWLNWGAIVCAIMCILIHGAIGVTFKGIIEMITVLIIVYGMLMVKEFTGNAWGCVFIFVFLWNAF